MRSVLIGSGTWAIAAVLGACGWVPRAKAQDAKETDHRVVLEAGAAGQRDVRGGPASWGGSLAAELTPVEGGLEYEVGLTAVSGSGDHEVSVDLLGMKSWDLARKVELMVGLGPEVAWHGGATALNAEGIVHLMWWPRPKVGLFVEPGFSYGLGRDGERSLGITAGLLLALL